MRARGWWVAGLMLVSLVTKPAPAQVSPTVAQPREPTDVFIRRKAGLPANSAKGDIEILDVGHLPLSTMLSIVAHRTPQGWRVSYACAESPHCAADPSVDHRALDYTLAPDVGARLDAALAGLAKTEDPGGMPPNRNFTCGHLSVWIDLPELKRDYTRQCAWGPTLGTIERLLQPPDIQR